MPTVWFIIVAVMLTVYVVLDGFDLGAGVIYLLAARTHGERRAILRAIGPVWDGNEVWLIATGGTLYFAFPQLYAAGFSGFYLPLMMVLWLLMLRAIGIEFRTHIDNPVWQSLFDVIFFGSSALLTIFYGAALGNVIRGVPIAADGYFFEPLWTNFRVGTDNGILDWYTVLTGIVALVALTTHGALYIVTKTEGDLARRARGIVLRLWPVQLVLTFASLAATCGIRPEVLNNYYRYPVSTLIPLSVALALAIIFWRTRAGQEKRAFMASSAYIAAMMVGAVFALYPQVLPASTGDSRSLTIYNSAAAEHGLAVGLVWWIFGAVIAIGYFVFIYRMFRGKVQMDSEGY